MSDACGTCAGRIGTRGVERNPGRLAVLAFAAAACILPATRTEGATWQSIAPQNVPPPARRDAAMVYDRARDRVIVFGGRAGAQSFNDTWAFYLSSRTWQALATGASARPTPRFSVVAGIDDQHQRLIIATGQGGAGFFNDAWSFDLASDTWTEIVPTGTPPHVRYGSAGGTYDPGSFLGGGSTLFLTHGFTDEGRFDDTWELDAVAPAWSDRAPTGPRPLKRCLHGGAMASATELIIFGGCASGFGPCPLGDTWRFDDATGSWTDLSQAVRPAARTFPALARMGDGRKMMLFGGRTTVNSNDAWMLDASTGSWTQLTPAGTPPTPRQSASLAWIDSSDRSLTGDSCGFGLVFGGASDAGERNDLWMLSPSSLPTPATLAAARETDAVRLSWSTDPGALRYEVWRSDDPRFGPGGTGLTLLPGEVVIEGSTATHVDQDLASPAPIRFYQVRLAACAF